jgi:hypothetical protein
MVSCCAAADGRGRGRTIENFVSSVDGRYLANLTVIPICADPPSYECSASELATRLSVACRAGSRCVRPPYHYSPLLKPHLGVVRDAARRADFVFLGVGPWRRNFTALEFVRHLG